MKRKMRKNLILFLSILLFGTLLAACSSKEGSGDSPAAKENSESAADTGASADSAEENGAEEESAAEAFHGGHRRQSLHRKQLRRL